MIFAQNLFQILMGQPVDKLTSPSFCFIQKCSLLMVNSKVYWEEFSGGKNWQRFTKVVGKLSLTSDLKNTNKKPNPSIWPVAKHMF